MKTFKLIIPAFTFCLLLGNAAAQNAEEIIKKTDDVLYSMKDQYSTVKIVNVDKNGNQKVQKAIVIQKGSKKRIFRFTEPASQKGIAFLSLPDEVMYVYMPAFGKERRIASHVKNQNFAGMVFSYEDLESKLLSEKYSAKILQTDNESYTVELVPKPNEKSEYSKVIMKINKKEFYPITAEYYDKAGKKIKISEYTFEKKGKYWSPTVIKMIDLRKNQSTSMILESVEYDKDISDEEFTVRKLIQ